MGLCPRPWEQRPAEEERPKRAAPDEGTHEKGWSSAGSQNPEVGVSSAEGCWALAALGKVPTGRQAGKITAGVVTREQRRRALQVQGHSRGLPSSGVSSARPTRGSGRAGNIARRTAAGHKANVQKPVACPYTGHEQVGSATKNPTPFPLAPPKMKRLQVSNKIYMRKITKL